MSELEIKVGYQFSQRSLDNLAQCHPNLQKIAHELIKEMDIVVICGHRGQADQEAAFRAGTSKLHWPHSAHNKTPAMAFDACPYPVNWEARAKFLEMRLRAKKIALRLGIGLRFIAWDLPHIELKADT